jgi:ribosomal-protein-alanine N-acetyltransferase
MRPPFALQTGERAYLRRPRRADRDEFLSLVRMSRSLHRPWTYPPADPASFEDFVRRGTSDDRASMLVCRVEDDAIAGVSNLGGIVRGHMRNAYVGFYAFAPYAGRGYMREGVDLSLRHAFLELRLHRVEANIQPGNERSVALAKRCGLRKEGFSPRYVKIGGRWRDHERWALLAEEWRTPQDRPAPRSRRRSARTISG